MRSRPRARSEIRRRDTARARVALAGGVALAVLGVAFGVDALVVPGAAFAMLGVLSPLWAQAGTAYVDARRTLVTRRAIEGDLLEAVIEVYGNRFGRSGASVSDPLSGRTFALVGGRRQRAGGAGDRAGPSVRVPIVARAGRRGAHRFPPPSLRFSDPLGLATIVRERPGVADQVVVLPRTEPVAWSATGGRRLGGEIARRGAHTGAGEVDGLREYRPGAPAARIHWPALARGAGLLERRLVSAADGRPLIVLDPRCRPLPEGLDDLDQAVRAVGSLARELAVAGGCSVLLPGLRLPRHLGADLRAWPALHLALALVAPERDWQRTPALRPEILRGPLLYVLAADLELPPSVHAGAYALIRVLPAGVGADAGGEAPLFQVAGCVGHRLQRRDRQSWVA